ncbi:hypothetical protein GCM10008106_14250 [Mongoliitalea lutea]|uniref:Tail specific protease domain-containing protein n=1 Tax=Mongoliitalea lutea TaxID=849756 RepID=A0A8J3G534_9BACT|nr:hypothetical protein GCM10008106_14250 [Mongoliitalea lutea]
MYKNSIAKICFYFLCFSIVLQNCTSKNPDLLAQHNLGFEVWTNKSDLSDGWSTWGDKKVEIDSTFSYEGKYSGKISSISDKESFGGIVYKIPIKGIIGDSVRLEGKIRFENISEGFVSLILRVEDNGNTIYFENLQDLNLNGTKDWSTYRITLPLGFGKDNLTIAGIIQGKGTAWFDDFMVEIDGKDINNFEIPNLRPEIFESDSIFDKGSEIILSQITDQQINNLAITAKIWSFLKYYHPEVNAGKFNWDYELFRVLPEILKAKNDKQRDQSFLKWIKNLGAVPTCGPCVEVSPDSFSIGNFDWVEQENISNELKTALKWIFKNRTSEEKFYVGPAEYGPAPVFTNELDYKQFAYPDDGFRLLALFRYWGVIEYFFPYKHLMDEDWNIVLKTFIPIFLNAKNALEYELALLQLITMINDSHASLNTRLIDRELRGDYYPPFKVDFIENNLVVTQPLVDSLSHLSGTVVSHFNGKEIHSIVDSIRPFFPASNEAALKRDMAWQILRSKTKSSTITFKKKGLATMDFIHANSFNSIYSNKNPDPESFKMLTPNIAYLNIKKLTPTELASAFEKIQSTNGLIIDLRTYPEHTLVYDLGAFLVKTPKGFVKGSLPQYNTPGKFYFTQILQINPNPTAFYLGKVILLVDENTQSAPEFHAMGLQVGENVMTIGSQTAGADGNVATIKIPGGYSTFFSGVGIYYPDGTETQRVGIKIDLEVKPTIQGVKEGRDEVLEKAIELLKK